MEFESSDLLIYPSNWGGGNIRVPQVPCPLRRSSSWSLTSIFLSLTWAYQSLSVLSYLVDFRIGITQSYCPVGYSVPWNYLFDGYGTQATDNGVLSFLHKPCFASAYVNTVFIKPFKWYRELCARIIEKVRRWEEIFLFKNHKIVWI